MNSEDEPSLLFLLLSHHRPSRLQRTIRVHVKGRNLYVCARCTGIWTGMISAFLAFFLGLDLPAWLYVSLLAVLPAPTMLDWVTQTCKLRESRNVIRVWTGYFLGISWGIFFLLLAKGIFHLFLVALTILGMYIFSIFLIARKTNFLDDYFNQ